MGYWGKLTLDKDKDTFYDNMIEQLERRFKEWESDIKAMEDEGGGGEEVVEPEEEEDPNKLAGSPSSRGES